MERELVAEGKPEPVMVTKLPPLIDPMLGVIPVMTDYSHNLFQFRGWIMRRFRERGGGRLISKVRKKNGSGIFKVKKSESVSRSQRRESEQNVSGNSRELNSNT